MTADFLVCWAFGVLFGLGMSLVVPWLIWLRPPQRRALCGCNHHVSYHMGLDGGCGWRRVWREGYGSEPKKCGCMRFVPKGNATTALIELGERSL
jgi:hypothetical protein